MERHRSSVKTLCYKHRNQVSEFRGLELLDSIVSRFRISSTSIALGDPPRLLMVRQNSRLWVQAASAVVIVSKASILEYELAISSVRGQSAVGLSFAAVD